ncbi:subtilisin-like protease SBT5.3 [Amborella trichopoda]|uniref:Subtilisin-like protease n=1 Tax=Amborella trichopoda TaxID=13333 RepID=U5DCG9_AMBTC|nr:subtilisin-like protease SBT5.3 [Amborella trichopoda]XP_020531131.1 subtilisin-like protease SBT5.3 [Amborella trichopoda]XP_020531132.1 subtilisin-like protease SBT5.3 [Amborella trichopoda]ERN19112.1 hypothetical protein AMTR_s00061p00140690 [Amborella trichopoda]|eukprot:XP_011628304.2 subtilisin-like protease SBT5.3 [Amborella trichopoda]
MAGNKASLCLLGLFFSLFHSGFAHKKPFVVYMGQHSHAPLDQIDHARVTESHHELLGTFIGSKEKAKDAIFYSYTLNVNGFAANLEEEEALEISKHPGVVSVFPDKLRELHTTRSWHFMGLERDGRVPKKSLWHQTNFGRDVIVANLDTGVWPESESFRDEGIGPVPSKWKGICQNDDPEMRPVKCNRKLIGVRYFNKGYNAYAATLNITPPALNSPRDIEGHGTHTLSTVAGSFVPNASIFGFASGTAKGGAPGARVAAYKVCWPATKQIQGGCFDSDILASFDAAIHDGVDVVSVSLGGDPYPFFEDATAIGAFHAARKGISVICSAGNSGPTPGSVTNLAPWILTVGASTLDRDFPTYVSIGGKHLKGQSLSIDTLPHEKFYPLISAADILNPQSNFSLLNVTNCLLGSLDPTKAKGKIVACLRGDNARVEKGEAVKLAGGVGMILCNDPNSGNEVIADAHVLPAAHLTLSDGAQVFSYIKSTKNPMAYITRPNTNLGSTPAPVMAAFSSQGPNTITPQILKPDITGPGVSILAAYTEATSPTDMEYDKRRVSFNVVSGTSMSCPHLSGVVALIKARHPNWSEAAIKSAIMTTAHRRDNVESAVKDASLEKATPFNYGAGHVRPNAAADPGLVYDLTPTDYLNFLCSLDYNQSSISAITDQNYTCPTPKPKLLDFNYPSFSITNLTSTVTVTRVVKLVGPPATYTVRVQSPTGVSIEVSTKSLSFEKEGEEKSYTVKFTLKSKNFGNYSFGRLIWSDGTHYVRSAIVINGV